MDVGAEARIFVRRMHNGMVSLETLADAAVELFQHREARDHRRLPSRFGSALASLHG